MMKTIFGFLPPVLPADNLEVPAQPGRANDAIPRLTAFKKSRRFMSCLIDASTDWMLLISYGLAYSS
jgi:hypothetical protein